MKFRRWLPLVFVLALALTGAAEQVEKASWYNQFFSRQSGWTGADGCYSYRLGNDKVLWSFSDTFFGKVPRLSSRDYRFAHNSQVLQSDQEFISLDGPHFEPPDGKGWFWMADGVWNGDFEALLGQFVTTKDPGAFAFRQEGLWWARAELDLADRTLKVKDIHKMPFFQASGGVTLSFGSAVFSEGPWHYILGIRDQTSSRQAVLARVPRHHLGNAGLWRFFDGKAWTKEIDKCQPIFACGSMESSLYQAQNGGYVSVASVDPFGQVVARFASNLTGPWSEPEIIYQAPESSAIIYAYNAKAHPHLRQGESVLVSYNVNTMDLVEVIEDASIYRPRFIWWTPKDPRWLPATLAD